METKVALRALAALAQENRLAIFRLLVTRAPEGLPAGVIGERLGLAPATLSFHLKELAHAGLISAQPLGRFIWYRADVEAMNELVAYLYQNCCGSSATCDPACVPAVTSQPVTVPATAMRKRRSS
jgi:DNA-binding transcriptional ArsR family regulator